LVADIDQRDQYMFPRISMSTPEGRVIAVMESTGRAAKARVDCNLPGKDSFRQQGALPI